MGKITRYPGNLKAFASEALGTERTIFGDTAQADDLASNITADFLRGWGIVEVNENPTKQDFNGLAYTVSQLIAYLHQMGVSEWDDEQEYAEHGLCIGSDGNVYQSQSATNIGNDPTTDEVNWKKFLTSSTGGNLRNIVTFTSSGAYTKPSWLKFAIVCLQGAGGGSAGQVNTERTSPGGSGGGYSLKKIASTSIGATETVTIGDGGSAGAAETSSEGGDGGTTSFGAHFSATGGGGSAYGLDAGRDAAAPGDGVDGDINIPGGLGHPGGPNNYSVYTGQGGDSQMGHGAPPAQRGGDGDKGKGYGSGASGAHMSSATARAGNHGQPGIAIVYEYE